MKRKLSKAISIFLALAMVVSLFSGLTVTASAAEDQTITVTNEAELIHAIRHATGTVENPTVIQITNNIALSQSLVVEDKNVKFLGVGDNITISIGSNFTYNSDGVIFIKKVNAPKLVFTFENIILDGRDNGNTHKWRMLASAWGNITINMEEKTGETTKIYGCDAGWGAVGGYSGVYGACIFNCGTFNMNGGTVYSTPYGIYLLSNSVFNLNDGLITSEGCSWTYNGIFFNGWQSNTTLNIHGGKIVTSAGGSYSGSAASAHYINMDGGTIESSVNNEGYHFLSGSAKIGGAIKVYAEDMNAFRSVPTVVSSLVENGDSANISVYKDTGMVAKSSDTYEITQADFESFHNVKDGYTLYMEKDTDSGKNAIYAAKERTITFNANGGTGDDYTQVVPSGVATVLTANTFTNADSGKKFLGWATDSGAATVNYPDGAQIKAEEDITLYAVWGDKEAWPTPEWEPKHFTYDGTAKGYTLADSDYSVTSYQQGNTTVENPTAAGSYDVVITRGGDADHAAYTNTLYGALVIDKAPMTITATAPTSSIHIGDAVPTDFSYEVTGLVAGDSLTTEPTVSTTADGTKAGEFPVTAKDAVAPNYAITYEAATLTVTPHEYAAGDNGTVVTSAACTTAGTVSYSCSVPGCTAGTYTVSIPALGHDYSAYSITDISAPDANGMFTVTETATCSRDDTHTTTRKSVHNISADRGTYEVTDTYTLWDCGYCALTYLKKADASFDAFEVDSTIADQYYTGSEIKPTVTVTKNGAPMSASDYTVEYTDNIQVGSATATVKVGEVTIGSAAFQIVKGIPTLTLSETTKTVYSNVGTTTFTVDYSGDGELVVSSSDESVATAVIAGNTVTVTVKKAGTAAITISAAETENYTANSATLALTVNQHSTSNNTPNYTVSISQAKHGSVSVSPKTASKNTTVTIAVTPDDGYKLDTLTVTDANGNKLTLTDKGDGKYTFTMPASQVTVEASFVKTSTPPANPFTDVKEGDYFYDAVLWAVENGITTGTTATTFSPDDGCTRAQAVTFLWRAAGSPEPTGSTMPFEDVDADAYYYDAVLWAVERGVAEGTSATTFSPNAVCTRAHIVTFLYRNAGSPATSGSNGFTDVAADAYYASAVQWAVKEGITNGTSDTTFSPADNCTRGQIVTFLFRAAE